MAQNFLIIGNGFDIAHGLKTQYPDFLSFCENYDENNPVSDISELNEEFSAFIKYNVWLRYFLKITWLPFQKRLDATWIDFEKEVSEIIQVIEADSPKIKSAYRSKNANEFWLELHGRRELDRFLLCFGEYDVDSHKYILSAENVTDLNSFLTFLYVQLRAFTRAFEIYCLKINQTAITDPIIFSERGMLIRKAEAERISSWQQFHAAKEHLHDDVEELEQLRDKADNRYYCLMSDIHPIDYLSMGRFSFVLSFNYTNTFERLYGDEKTKYCYIHGKAQENKECTNLILGIDDNLSNGDESRNFQCVRFKKYYQRIIFKTGAEYKDWLTAVANTENYVHIVGHSLDCTDYDVLYEFFSDSQFKIIVYYYNDKDFEEKIQRVIRLLAYKGGNGRDELIKRVHGKDWSIKFVYQYDETDGLFKAPTTSTDEFLEVDAN